MSNKSLSEFVSATRKNGLVLSSKFYVEVLNSLLINGDVVGMYCESTNLPGMNIATVDARVFGENRSSPYMPLYPDLNLTFLVDADMKVLTFFEQWMNAVVNRRSRTLGYYNDYVNDLNIHVLNKLGDPIWTVMCKEVYPKSMSDLRFDSNNRDIAKLDVNFAMKYWELEWRQDEDLTKVKDADNWPGDMGFGAGGDFTAENKFPEDPMRCGKSLTALTTGSSLNSFGQKMNEIGQLSPKVKESMGKLSMGIETVSKQIGSVSGELAAVTNGISGALTSITAPLSQASTAISSMSNLFGTLNTVTGTLGLGSPFSKAQSLMNNASGALAVVSNLRGIPGAISSVGSAMSAAGSAIGGISGSIKSLAGGAGGLSNSSASKIGECTSTVGASFSKYGFDLQRFSGSVNPPDVPVDWT